MRVNLWGAEGGGTKGMYLPGCCGFSNEARKSGREITLQGSVIPHHSSLFSLNITHSPRRLIGRPVFQPTAHLWVPPRPGF